MKQIIKNISKFCFKKPPEIGAILLLFLMNFPVFSQKNQEDSLTRKFIDHQINNPQEKIFVHTAKDFFLVNETCWFKLYLVDAYFNKLLNISKIAYVEIINAEQKPVIQQKISLQNGMGQGSILIKNTLPTGHYTFRAYTNWMKNYPIEYFFEKDITIVNMEKSDKQDNVEDNFEIGVFPEGGNLVNNIESKVAFKVTKNGLGVNSIGFLLNEKSDTLLKVLTYKFGIGTFQFKPETNHQYHLEFQIDSQKTVKKILPDAYLSGTVMQVSDLPKNEIIVNIKTKSGSLFYLLVHSKGVLKNIQKVDIQENSAKIILNKDQLNEGISQITLFNASGQPICERLVFNYPKQTFSIDANLNKNSFVKRENVSLNLHTTDVLGQSCLSNLSMAVYEIDSLQKAPTIDITNYFWLSSDLSGNVETPQYYFDPKNTDAAFAMDQLMLTHGWRRFNWKAILTDDKPILQFIPEYKGHIISGQILQTADNQSFKGVEAYISFPNKRGLFARSESKANGKLQFELSDFYNNGELTLQTIDQNNNAYNIEIKSPFLDKNTISITPEIISKNIDRKSLQKQFETVQVEAQYHKQENSNSALFNSDTTAFYQKPNYSFLLDDYVRFPTMEEVIREYMPPVLVRKRSDVFHLLVYDEVTKKFFEDDPLVLVDGLPILKIDELMAYNPAKVKKADVVSMKYHYNGKTYYGLINLTTYQGNLPEFNFNKKTTIIDYQGLERQREFYSPQYKTKEQLNSRLPDFRNLLYWNPSITTDRTGNALASFYTSDISGRYLVVIQGVTSNGETGVKIFEINSK